MVQSMSMRPAGFLQQPHYRFAAIDSEGIDIAQQPASTCSLCLSNRLQHKSAASRLLGYDGSSLATLYSLYSKCQCGAVTCLSSLAVSEGSPFEFNIAYKAKPASPGTIYSCGYSPSR